MIKINLFYITSFIEIDMKKNLVNKFIRLIILATFLCLISTSCTKDEFLDMEKVLTIDYNGRVNKIETLGYYSLSDAVLFLQLAKLPGKVETTCGFYLYRVTYQTKNFDDSEIWVSGLLAVPDSKKIKGVVSYQHGTNTSRHDAPSKPSRDEGIGISSLFAGNGYVLLIPDYIGLGVSQEIPTYLHIPSTVNAVVDFITIGAKVLNELTAGQNANLYLTGFSQGGCATAGVHRALEINNPTGLTLKASACVAGAYNLKDISVKYAVANKSMIYLGYAANSFAHVYKQDLRSIIKEEYVNLVPTLFDGSKSADFIQKALPEKAEDLYTQHMIHDIVNGNSNWFTTAFGQNETYRWRPIAKIRLFYGAKDLDVSPQDAIAAYNYMKNLGGNVEILNTGDQDHLGSLLSSLPEIQKWFNNTK